MLKVTALYEHGINGRPHGSAYIRTMLTLAHPSVKNSLDVNFATGFVAEDVLLIDRTWTPYITPGLAEQTLRQARREGMKIIYSLDDNLADVNDFSPYRRVFSDDQVEAVRRFAREADRIVVSTEPLKARMLRINPDVSVIPNYLDEQLFPKELPRRKPAEKLTIGYMGTASHESDLLSILEPLRKVLTRHRGRVSLELVGVLEPHRVKLFFGDLPVKVREVPVEDVEYPDFVKWMLANLEWDIGLAPLENTPFTVCKSDIKWLDYALQGIPGVFSESAAYSGTVEDGVTGLVAENNPSVWFAKLNAMVEDAALRARLRANAYETVCRKRTLECNAVKWLDLLSRG